MTHSTRFFRFAGSLMAECRYPAVAVVGASVLMLAVSCSDAPTITGVPAKVPGASLVSAHQGPVVSDVIVMHRSTQVAAHHGVPAVHKSFTEKIGGSVRAVRKDEGELPSTAGPDFSAGELARPVMSLPARLEIGICSALPTWSKAERTAAGGTALSSGTGDGPASVVKIKAEDGTLLTVERTWVRTSRTWQLDRQVTTTADKRYRDEVVYEHQSESGEHIDRALPVVACAGARGPGISPAVASHSFYAPHTTSLTARLFPLTEGVAADYACGTSDCFAEQNAVYSADVALAGAATIAAYACTFVAVVVPAACLAAGVAWTIAVGNLAFAQRTLNHCLYLLNHLVVQPLSPFKAFAVTGSLAVSDAAGRASRILDTPPTISADCSGGGSSGAGTLCHYENFEISYDGGLTWSWLASVLVCV